MANEAIPIILTNSTGYVRSFNCANGTEIKKGTLLKLTDPNTAIISSASTDVICGIAADLKEASDDATTIGAFTDGVFKMYASGAITVGDLLLTAADANFPNYVRSVVAADAALASQAKVIGYSLETATAGQTFRARIRL